MKTRLSILSLLLALTLLLGACSASPKEETPEVIRVAALNGPTGIGLVKLMADNDAGEVKYTYDIQLVGSPEEMTGLITSGQVDIAAVPTNLASVLYNKTQKGVQLLAINTLGVLSIVERGETLQSIGDLAGSTLPATGQGSMPEYVLNFILEQNGLTESVPTEYLTEHAELATQLLAGNVNIALLPQPFVTTVTMKDPTVRIALNLTEEWAKACELYGQPDAVLAQGALVVQSSFAKEHPAALAGFLDEYAASVDYVNANVAEAAELVAGYGILPSAEVAAAAIPNCNIVCISGDKMPAALGTMFEVLFAANPASVGGALPEDDFYYIAK